MTTALIADDEPSNQQALAQALKQAWPELELLPSALDGIEVIERFDQGLRPDVTFLDIRMPGMTGIEVAKHINQHTRIVFVTAYDQYALQAFDAGGVDYLLKPIEPERLEQTVVRVKERLSTQTNAATPAVDLSALLNQLAAHQAAKPKLQWIKAKTGAQVRLIHIDDVLLIEADAKATVVYTKEREAVITTPLKELVDELDANKFWQIHRGAIINVNAIDVAVRDDDDRITVKLKGLNKEVPVSRPYYHLFKGM